MVYKDNTAKDFHLNPAKYYRKADRGESVQINHKHYPDKTFILVAIEREEDE